MDRQSWNPCTNMTGKGTSSERQGRLKRGKSLEIQDIVRGKTVKKEGRARPPDREDYRIYRLTKMEWVRWGGTGLLLCGLAAYTFYRSLAVFFLMVPAGLLYPLYKRKDLKKERLRQLTVQFKEGILILSSFLNAGYSLENGLSMSIKELDALYGSEVMITKEFSRLVSGVRMNQAVEVLLTEFGERSGIADVEYFAQVLTAARKSGGELVEIIHHTSGIIRDKIQVQEEIYTMTAARVFEQKIMNGIPFLIVFYIDFTSPGFFNAIYGTWGGRCVMTVCLGLYAGAVLLASRILEIEV